jgi:integrase
VRYCAAFEMGVHPERNHWATGPVGTTRSWKSSVPGNPTGTYRILGWRPLAEAMPEWLETAETVGSGPIAERTRKSYACNIRQLLKFADSKGGNAPTDAQLPELLEEFREYCIDREHWVPFNQVKTMCLSYARGTQSKRRDSDLYIALRRVAGLNTSKRKRERKSITVREVYEIMAKLPEREAQHLWNMCCLSIRPDEYARGQWEICRHDDYGEYVLITGTKNDNAERPVPLVKGVKKVRFAESTFRRCFRNAVGDKYVPRDCRSTGKRWRKDAGVSATRNLQYFAHSTAAMEHRYDTDELLPFVGPDAELINAFIEKQSGSFKILHQPVAELASV